MSQVIGAETIGNTGERMSNVSMRLFGVPYQLPNSVDPRYDEVNSGVGINYLERFLFEAPILTIIPGDPVFLPTFREGEKAGAAQALIEAADAGLGKFQALKSAFGDKVDNLRLYDFKKAYLEYMQYVNILCRVGAGFLDLNANYTINGSTVDFQNFDWKTWKWTKRGSNPNNFLKIVSGNFLSRLPVRIDSGDNAPEDPDSMSFSNVLSDYDYVQFYIDPDSTSSDSMDNRSTDSKLKGLLDQGTDTTREFAWMLKNSEMGADMAHFAEESSAQLGSLITEVLGGGDNAISGLGAGLSRILNLSGRVVMGENVMIPKLYQNSEYNSGSFSATIHLKAPYGNILSYYLDVYVPLMHLIALTIPRQSTANTYSSPFLCKSFVEGSWTCNLGLITNLSITKANEARSIHGLPSEIDVQISFEDFYETLTMNPSTDPVLFMKNSSLIEYLATNCGMSLTKPNTDKKVNMLVNTAINSVTDIPGNIYAFASNKIFEKIVMPFRKAFTVGYR